MFLTPLFGLYLATALTILLLPGPAVVFLLTKTFGRGRRSGLASVAGVELAAFVYAVAAAVGLAVLLEESALDFEVVKLVGAGYLVYLGVHRILRKETSRTLEMKPTTPLRDLVDGFVVNLFNPKVALFFCAFLPQFVDPAAGSVAEQIFLLGLVWVGLASCTDSMYVILGSSASQRVKRWATGNSILVRSQRFITGGVYVALGLAAALTSSTESW